MEANESGHQKGKGADLHMTEPTERAVQKEQCKEKEQRQRALHVPSRMGHRVERILIDGGMSGRVACNGMRKDSPPSHSYLIGKTLAEELERYGYEVLFSGDVPELNDHGGAGRPGLCATIAKRWGADVVLRICVRASELPSVGTVGVMVFKKNTEAWCMAQSVLGAVESGSNLDSQGITAAQRFLLLRRAICPCAILILGLPFRQKEFLFETEIKNYAECIAEGLHSWAQQPPTK